MEQIWKIIENEALHIKFIFKKKSKNIKRNKFKKHFKFSNKLLF